MRTLETMNTPTHTRRESNRKIEVAFMRLLVAILKPTAAMLLLIALLATAHADDRKRNESKRHESHNWIIERQQAYQVQGVPTSRLIIGKREIDIYPNGLMFEKGNVVGVKGGR
jgi:hypothetical protein